MFKYKYSLNLNARKDIRRRSPPEADDGRAEKDILFAYEWSRCSDQQYSYIESGCLKKPPQNGKRGATIEPESVHKILTRPIYCELARYAYPG